MISEAVPIKRFLIIAACLITAPGASAEIYGLKSRNIGPNGHVPTVLYQFLEDGSSFNEIATLVIGGSQIDADGLALSSTGKLIAFQVQPSGSRLIELNPSNGTVLDIKSELAGRNIRGAAFDSNDHLWAIDEASNALLQIDPSTGQLINSAVTLMNGGITLDLHPVTDIAINASGEFYIANRSDPSDLSDIYILEPSTGTLAYQFTHSPNRGIAGLAFSQDSQDPDRYLFAYDQQGNDDLLVYDLETTFNSTLHPNIISYFNSGSGDLAAFVRARLTADFDNDGDVDGVDLAVIFASFNGPGGGVPANPDTDLDGDGDADGVDLAAVFSQFTGPLVPANVPEPSSIALLALGGWIMARRRRPQLRP